MSDIDARNAETSRQEVRAFLADPPDRYFAYRSRDFDRITTWVGDDLARVTWRGNVWRSNFGDRRQAFRCRTAVGVEYAGTSYIDAGDYVRMRRIQSN